MKKLIYLLAITILIISCNENELQSNDDFTGDKGTFIDERDGNTYNWVKIGDQIWMAENLAYLPKINSLDDQSLSEPCYYVSGYEGTSIDEAIASTGYNEFGVLYNWAAANLSCPEGWHLPSDAEWERLAEFISEDNGGFKKQEKWGYDDAGWYEVGKQLKAISGINEGNGTDNYGFTAKLSGYYDANKEFRFIDNAGRFWTATEESMNYSWYRYVNASTTLLYVSTYINVGGFCVRCIKD